MNVFQAVHLKCMNFSVCVLYTFKSYTRKEKKEKTEQLQPEALPSCAVGVGSHCATWQTKTVKEMALRLQDAHPFVYVHTHVALILRLHRSPTSPSHRSRFAYILCSEPELGPQGGSQPSRRLSCRREGCAGLSPCSHTPCFLGFLYSCL